MEEGRIIIHNDGRTRIEGHFPQEFLITLLRKELLYQKELEKLSITKQVKKELQHKEG